MSHFNSNIKLLRKRRHRTQDIVAGELGISRSTLNSYENETIKNPNIDMLIKCSEYFRVSIDILIKKDLSKYTELQMSQIELNDRAS